MYCSNLNKFYFCNQPSVTDFAVSTGPLAHLNSKQLNINKHVTLHTALLHRIM